MVQWDFGIAAPPDWADVAPSERPPKKGNFSRPPAALTGGDVRG
jgi:hypothetical protein